MTKTHTGSSEGIPFACCGEVRTTPFCPLCGKQSAANTTLLGLLRHVEKYARSQRASADSIATEENDRTDSLSRRRRRYAERHKKTAMRWEAWRDALRELLEKAAENGAIEDQRCTRQH